MIDIDSWGEDMEELQIAFLIFLDILKCGPTLKVKASISSRIKIFSSDLLQPDFKKWRKGTTSRSWYSLKIKYKIKYIWISNDFFPKKIQNDV